MLKSNDLPLSFTDLEEVCFLIYNVKKKIHFTHSGIGSNELDVLIL